MLGKSVFANWLKAHPFTGPAALTVVLLAVAIPTALRASVESVVSGIPVTTYIPFVLVAALLAGWLNASIVAFSSAMIGDVLFVGKPYDLLEGPEDWFVVGVFLVACAVIIGFVQLVRSILSERETDKGQASGIIFSLENGQAWASSPYLGGTVRLGPQAEVAEMMEDFLAQLELGKRLARMSA